MKNYKLKEQDNQVIFIIIIATIILLLIFIGSKLLKKDITDFDKEKLTIDYKKANEVLKTDKLDINALKILAGYYYLAFKREELLKNEFANKNLTKEIVNIQLKYWENYGISTGYFKSKLNSIGSEKELTNEYLKLSETVINNLIDMSLLNYHRLLGIDENSIEAADYYKIGMLYYKKGIYYYHIAKKYLFKALDNRYENAKIYVLLGDIFFEEKNFNEAEKWFKKSYKLNDDSVVLIYNYAKTLFYENKLDESLDIIEAGLNQLKNFKSTFLTDKSDYKNNKELNIEFINMNDKYIFTRLILLKMNVYLKQNRINDVFNELNSLNAYLAKTEEYYSLYALAFEKSNNADYAILNYKNAMMLSSSRQDYYKKKIRQLENTRD